ncbi:hypothetical protein MTO96_005608 [Rhipicephalus appendiculatus]
MVSTLALCSAVALLVVGARAAPTDESSTPAQRPGVFEEILEEMGLQGRPIYEVGSQNVTRQLDLLEKVDRYAPTPEIAQSIRSKWVPFFVCISHRVGNL